MKTMATPYEELSEEERDTFQYIDPLKLIEHVGEYLNIIWFKDKQTMDLFYKRAGPRVRKVIGPQKTGVAQSKKTGKFFVIFHSDIPFMIPGYKVAVEGVQMKSLFLYP